MIVNMDECEFHFKESDYSCGNLEDVNECLRRVQQAAEQGSSKVIRSRIRMIFMNLSNQIIAIE